MNLSRCNVISMRWLGASVSPASHHTVIGAYKDFRQRNENPFQCEMNDCRNTWKRRHRLVPFFVLLLLFLFHMNRNAYLLLLLLLFLKRKNRKIVNSQKEFQNTKKTLNQINAKQNKILIQSPEYLYGTK